MGTISYMKVIFFTNNLFGKDGWSKYSLDLVRALDQKGVECVCFVQQKNKDINLKQIEVLRSPLHYLRNPLLLLLDFKKIKKIIFRENPSLIHYLIEPYALFHLFVSRSYKTCMTIHGTYALQPLRKIRTRWLAKKYYKYIDKVISVSNYTKDRLLREDSELKSKTITIHNGINLDNLAKNFFDKKDKIKQIVFVGAVKPRKGVLGAIKALGVYKKINNNFIYNVVGDFDKDSSYGKEILKTVKNCDLKDIVVFHGRINQEKKEKILKEADLFLMLSKVVGNNFEGFGLAYLEANSFGVPVIGPNNSGASEAIKNNYSGYIVDVNNFKEVAEKIHTVLHGKVIDKQDCLNWAKQHDVTEVAGKVFDIYKKLII